MDSSIAITGISQIVYQVSTWAQKSHTQKRRS